MNLYLHYSKNGWEWEQIQYRMTLDRSMVSQDSYIWICIAFFKLHSGKAADRLIAEDKFYGKCVYPEKKKKR